MRKLVTTVSTQSNTVASDATFATLSLSTSRPCFTLIDSELCSARHLENEGIGQGQKEVERTSGKSVPRSGKDGPMKETLHRTHTQTGRKWTTVTDGNTTACVRLRENMAAVFWL